jgi:hypothetical protein
MKCLNKAKSPSEDSYRYEPGKFLTACHVEMNPEKVKSGDSNLERSEFLMDPQQVMSTSRAIFQRIGVAGLSPKQ